jgi:hypothetical protein
LPTPFVLKVMTVAVEADDHGGELAILEDKTAVGVVAINEHAQGLERDVEGHAFAFHMGREVSWRMARHPKNRTIMHTGWPECGLTYIRRQC